MLMLINIKNSKTIFFCQNTMVTYSRPAKIPKGLIFYFWGHVLFKAVTHVKLLHYDVLFKIGVDNIF